MKRAPRAEKAAARAAPAADLPAVAEFWIHAAVATSILIFIPGLLEPFEPVKATAVAACGVAGLAAAWIGTGRSPLVPRTPLDWTVLAWLAAREITTLNSASRRLSLFGEPAQRDGLITSIALVCVYFAARGAPIGGAAAGRLLRTFLVASAVAGGYAIVQALGIDPLEWLRPALYGDAATGVVRPFGTLGHPNLLGVVTAAATAIALARTAETGSRRRPHLALAAATVATAITLSRAAWLGWAAAAAVTLLLLIRSPLKLQITRRMILSGGAVLIAFAGVLAMTSWGEAFVDRVMEMFSLRGGTGRTRREIWRTALAMWQASPWFGHGPDTFALAFPRFQTPEYWRFEWSGLPLHAHNIYLNTLATGGVVVAAVSAGWLAALGMAWRSAWASEPVRPRLAGVAGAVAALAICGAFGALGISGALWFVAASGMVAAAAVDRGTEASTGPRAARASRAASSRARAVAAWLTGTILAVSVVTFAAREHRASRAAAVAEDQIEWARNTDGAVSAQGRRAALTAARRAAALSPYDDLIARLCAEAWLATAAQGVETGNALREGEAYARRAVRLVPARAANHEQLGRVLAARALGGDTTAVAGVDSAFAAALALAPVNGLVLSEYASIQQLLGRPERAAELQRREAELYPDRPR